MPKLTIKLNSGGRVAESKTTLRIVEEKVDAGKKQKRKKEKEARVVGKCCVSVRVYNELPYSQQHKGLYPPIHTPT